MRLEHGSPQSMLRTKGVACEGVDEVTWLDRLNTRKKGKEGPCRAFCKCTREMGWPLEERILTSKAVWSVWVFCLSFSKREKQQSACLVFGLENH